MLQTLYMVTPKNKNKYCSGGRNTHKSGELYKRFHKYRIDSSKHLKISTSEPERSRELLLLISYSIKIMSEKILQPKFQMRLFL